MTDAERLQLLEERYAHLQRHVAEQDKVMLKLGDELARVQQELVALRALSAEQPGPGPVPPEERPPHY